MQPPRALPRTPGQAGILILIAWLIWAFVAAGAVGQLLPLLSPYVVAPLALGSGVVIGPMVRRAHSALAYALVAGLAVVLLLGAWSSPGPAKLPLGYANANAALAVQLLGLCGLLLIHARGLGRPLLAVTSLGLGGAVVANGSRAGFAVCVPLALLVLWTAWRPPRSTLWRVGAGLLASTAIVAAALGVLALAGSRNWPTGAVIFIDETRQRLWEDALALWTSNLVRGAGPGSFARYSPLAVDSDTASAHSSVLQVGAETGAVGAALFAAIVIGGILWLARGDPPYAIVGIATWAALVVHSFVDHLVDFPLVVLLAGVVIGFAGASHRSEELNVPQSQDPLRG